MWVEIENGAIYVIMKPHAVPWRMGKIRGKGCGEGRAGDDN